MNTPKQQPKINTKTSKEREGNTYHQSKNRIDPEYLKMIQRVLDEVFPKWGFFQKQYLINKSLGSPC